jgi:hypothetical protein
MNTQSKTNIIVFGIDKFGYRVPDKPLELKNSVLHFRYFKTEDKFQDYDGVIVFQNTFEQSTDYGVVSRFDEKELLKRENQLRELIEKKGFCCFLLWTYFIDSDHDGERDTSYTDLGKRTLNHPKFYRQPVGKATTNLRIVRDEFRQFLKNFRSAQTIFESHNTDLNIKPICYAGDSITGFILNNSIFYIPSLQPGKREKEFKEFFSLLAEGLVSSFKKLAQELPKWTEEYLFKEEEKLLAEKDSISKRIADINQRLAMLSEYKKCLCYNGELLNESVISIMQSGFKFQVDPEDDLKEDMKILDQDKKPMILVEIKGTNKGVSREFINQADSHRERSGFPVDFPSILIVNTNIKNAKSLEDKYQEIAKEQVSHAVKMKILVFRTIDLLNLLYLVEAGQITPEEVLETFKREHGWLKVTQEGYQIEKETG